MAIAADPEELMAVPQQCKAMLGGDFLLPPLNLGIYKLNYLSTVLADHVIMMGSVSLTPIAGEIVLIAEAAVPDIHFVDKIHLLQNVQGAVDGGPGNGNAGVFQRQVNFIYLPVLVAAQDICQYGTALGGQTQILVLQRLLEVCQFEGGNVQHQSY